MKKTILFALAFCTLASCSNKTANETPDKTVITTETTTTEETAQEIEIPPATERESLNEVIYEDDNVTIIYDGYESLKTVQRLYLTIENKKDNVLRCKSLDFKANGTPIEQHFGSKVDPHSTFTSEITIINSKFQDVNITRVNKMEFKFNIWFEPIIEKVTGSDREIQVTTATGENIESYDTGVLTIER